MHRYITPILSLAILVTGFASAQTPKPDVPPVKDAKGAPPRDKNVKPADTDPDNGVHRMVITNGANRTVHYFSKNGSTGEQAALRGLERAENEATLADDLQNLRGQYLSTERALEARRRQVQMQFYGLATENSTTNSTTVTNTVSGPPSVSNSPINAAFSPGFGGGFGSRGNAIGFNSPGTSTSLFPGSATGNSSLGLTSGVFPGGVSGLGFGFPGFFGGFGGGLSGSDSTTTTTEYGKSDSKVSRGLQHGIGDEGMFKREMVAQMARQSGSEFSNSAAANLDRALNNVAVVFSNRPQGKDNGVRVADFSISKPRKAKVTLKNNTVISGVLIREDSDWIVLQVDDSEERIRLADVARVSLQVQK